MKKDFSLTGRLLLIAVILTFSLFFSCGGGGGSGSSSKNNQQSSDITGNQLIQNPTADNLRAYIDMVNEKDAEGDIDGDGLTNGFEISELNLSTLPDLIDSDNDGLKDSEEDADSDGLTNLEEQTYHTNPLSWDSDNDELEDSLEISYGTDPLSRDTDGDGLNDGDEILLGTDPLYQDSDGDGIVDSEEIFDTLAQDAGSGITAVLTGEGNAASGTTIVVTIPDDQQKNIVGIASSVINLHSEKDFNQAEIKIPISNEMLNAVGGDQQKLKIVLIDYENKEIIKPTSQGVSNDNLYLWAKVTHFSKYAVINDDILSARFAEDFNGSTRSGSGGLDLVLVIDSSGSMSTNDPSNLRIDSAKNLIDGLTDATDRVAIIDFDSSAKLLIGLTNNFVAAKNATNGIDSSGGTNLGVGISASINHILSHGNGNSPLIIMLTDGVGSYNNDLSDTAKNNDIRIYTVGLGAGVNTSLLEEIANTTNGRYFAVSNALQLADLFETLREETLDTDQDGLPDFAESNGMRTWLGTVIFTDPNDSDTDNDGLLDGDEMSSVRDSVNGLQYNMVSDPNKSDTDGDGLNDKDELDLGVNPLKADTDDDGLLDGIDRYPNSWDWYGSELRPGDIIVVGHPLSFHGKRIESILAMYQWSHAVMYMGDEIALDSHPGNPNEGVDWSDIHEFLYNPDYDRIAFLRVWSENDTTALNAADNAEDYIGSRFEFPGWGTFESTFGSDDSLYCAELVYKSWEPEGIDLRLFGSWSPFPWVRPNDIYTSIHTRRIKEIQNMPSERPEP